MRPRDDGHVQTAIWAGHRPRGPNQGGCISHKVQYCTKFSMLVDLQLYRGNTGYYVQLYTVVIVKFEFTHLNPPAW